MRSVMLERAASPYVSTKTTTKRTRGFNKGREIVKTYNEMMAMTADGIVLVIGFEGWKRERFSDWFRRVGLGSRFCIFMTMCVCVWLFLE